MSSISKEELKSIASDIILSHTEDIEFLTVWEMTEDRLPFEELDMEDMEKTVNRVDELIRKARVTVTFE